MKKNIPILLIITGLIFVAAALFIELSTSYKQDQIVKEYVKYIDELESNENTENKNLEIKDPVVINEEKPEAIENTQEIVDNLNIIKTQIDEDKITGIIEIPKLNVKAAILEGTDDSALKYSVGHYPGTAGLGEKGNCVLLGHRNYVYGHYFRKLNELKTGDEVIIKKDLNIYTYIVTESFVVKPEETWVLDQSKEAYITMITCTPIGTYTHRLIVKGVLK